VQASRIRANVARKTQNFESIATFIHDLVQIKKDNPAQGNRAGVVIPGNRPTAQNCSRRRMRIGTGRTAFPAFPDPAQGGMNCNEIDFDQL
jgi:hypothetical protein